MSPKESGGREFTICEKLFYVLTNINFPGSVLVVFLGKRFIVSCAFYLCIPVLDTHGSLSYRIYSIIFHNIVGCTHLDMLVCHNKLY